ncbi:hypothetical protein AVEN_120501-1 [Araneus ventricosus]|uniref:Uncharacterized protein n=1 Tax=Araneus ventricosus TaxID=182803 RepID=A0A4Y2TQ21_ARAVE|nr:hypothetical protein AVEN_120501-1 [Araneus ventricosus]
MRTAAWPRQADIFAPRNAIIAIIWMKSLKLLPLRSVLSKRNYEREGFVVQVLGIPGGEEKRRLPGPPMKIISSRSDFRDGSRVTTRSFFFECES